MLRGPLAPSLCSSGSPLVTSNRRTLIAEFLIELYRSQVSAGGLEHEADQARLAAEELTRDGTPVRFLRSIYVASDETCFLLYEAASPEHVAEAARRAGVVFERICEAVTHTI